VEVLYQLIIPIGLFNRQNRSVIGGVGWEKKALREKL
jgi:hypothetical protein